MLIEAVDALHDDADISDRLAERLALELTEAERLDLFLLTGWYHAISFVANAARVPLEPGVPRFTGVDSADDRGGRHVPVRG